MLQNEPPKPNPGEQTNRKEGTDGRRIVPVEPTELIAGNSAPTSVKSRRSERRKEERVPYVSQAAMVVQLRHPGGSIANYLVRTRDLSTEGIGFLHGSFVYTGTPCVVAMRPRDRSKPLMPIEGRVMRCQYTSGRIHEIGVKFDHPINLAEYVTGVVGESNGEGSTIELPRLCGNVLVVEDQTSDLELLLFHLEAIGIKAKSASNGMEALDHLENGKFDLLITSVWLPGMTGAELVETARAGGFKGSILAMTSDESGETRLNIIRKGCTAIMNKPFELGDLVKLLARFLRTAPPAGMEKVVSDMWSNQKMRPLIIRFLSRLGADLNEIERLAGAEPSSVQLAKRCMALKGSAGGYGYPQISRSANQLLGNILDEKPAAEIQVACAALAQLCRSALTFLDNAEAKAFGDVAGKIESAPAAPGDASGSARAA